MAVVFIRIIREKRGFEEYLEIKFDKKWAILKRILFFSSRLILLFPLKHGTKGNKEQTIDESSKKSLHVTYCKPKDNKIL